MCSASPAPATRAPSAAERKQSGFSQASGAGAAAAATAKCSSCARTSCARRSTRYSTKGLSGMSTTSSMPSCGDELTNPALTRLPDSTRLLAIALTTVTDSWGRWVVDMPMIRSLLWPHRSKRAPRPTPADLEVMLLELDETGWLTIAPHPKDPSATIIQINTDPLPGSPTSSCSMHSPRRPPRSGTCSAECGGEAPERSPQYARGGIIMPLPTALRGPLPEHPGSAPDPRNHAAEQPVNKSIIGREGEGESGRARDSGPAAPAASQPPEPSPSEPHPPAVPRVDPSLLDALRVAPTSFCPVHPQGPLPGVSCPDCGTARARATRHAQLRTARRAAKQLPGELRRHTLAGIDAELRALEAASDAASARRPAVAPTLPGMEYSTPAPEAATPPDDFSDVEAF